MHEETACGRQGAMSPRAKAIVDRLSVALFGVCWIIALASHAPSLFTNDLRLSAPLGVLAGYLCADFLAGAVHWLADRYFDPTTRLLGPLLIAPFREHHVDPMSIARHDFFEVSGNNSLVTAPAALGLLALPRAHDFESSLVCVFGFAATLALVATNQFHGWAHAPSPPRFARVLHALGIILTPRRHAQHHHSNFDRAYCVTSGWLNPVLDGTRFFDRVERAICRLARVVRIASEPPAPDPIRPGSTEERPPSR